MGVDAETDEEVAARLRKPIMRRLKDDIDDLHNDGKITVDGNSMITHLVSMYWGMRGFPEMLQDIALSPLMQRLGIGSADGTVLKSLIFTPWAMKPLFAITSDLFGFGFFKKRWYMAVVAALGAVACVLLFFSSEASLAADKATLLLLYYLVMNMCIALCDSLSQGKYTEICKWKGSTVVSFVSMSKNAAYLLASLVGPNINDIKWLGPQSNVLLLAPFFGQAAVVTGMNFMGDLKLPSVCHFDKGVWEKDWKIVINGLALGFSAAMLVVFRLGNFKLSGEYPSEACDDAQGAGCVCVDDEFLKKGSEFTTADPNFLLGYSVFSVLLNLSLTFWSLPKSIALINVYIMLCRVLALDVRYVLQQWYTTQADTCPVGDDGVDRFPRFPNTIYQMVGLVLGTAMTLVGIWIFENYVYYWNARAAFWVTTIFTVIAALFDLSMLTQFNQTLWSWLPFMSNKITLFCNDKSCSDANSPGGAGYRLDDTFGFLIGMQALKPIALTLDDMPSTVLLSKLCPAGVETTVFAILAALMNLGLTVSGLVAGYVFTYGGVTIEASSETVCGAITRQNPAICNLGGYFEGTAFEMNGIVGALILGGMLLPLLSIPFTFCLIPNKPLNGDFIEDDIVPGQEVEMQDPMADPNAAPHPAIAFGKASPSFASLAGATAPREELEKASVMMLGRRSGSALMSGSRMM